MKRLTLLLLVFFFALQLNGQTTWSEISLPPTTPVNGQLFELKVVSTNLAYTVGNKIQSNGSPLGLIFKYDGTSWVEMVSPATIIKSIAPINENDIYALSGNSVFHWDGSDWTDISSTLPDYNANPNFDDRILFKMIAFASNDVWVIGKILNISSGQGDLETYAVHFDGSTWTAASIPQSSKLDNVGAGLVMEVDATGPNDIWIATRGYIENNGTTQLGIWHYDGNSWAFVGEMVPAAGNVFLRDVSVVSTNDVWFAGYYSPSQGILAAFYAHYDGSTYSYTDQPLPVTDYQRYCIGALDNNNVWSGNQTNGTDFTSYNGSAWSTQTTIITNSTGGGIRDIKSNNGCLWAVGYSTVSGTKPMLLETCLAPPLAVELTHFEALGTEKSILLNWQTNTELNSDYFDIQKSTDGKSWISLGKVNAQRNSSEPNLYQYSDFEPFFGLNYYRLKMIDFDGSFEYSPIEGVVFEHAIELTIFPNPNSGEFTLFLNSEQSESIEIYNALGVLMHSEETRGKAYINLSNAVEGVYILKSKSSSKVFVIKR